MKKFFWHFFLFVTPLILVFSFPFVVFFISGEFTPFATLIERQMENSEPLVVGRSYVPIADDFILQSILTRKPNILVIGNSRVFEFRKQFFRENFSFYNAALATHNASEFRKILEKIPTGQEPKLILIGLEQSFFIPDWTSRAMNSSTSDNSSLVSNSQKDFEIFLKKWSTPYKDYSNKKFTFAKLLQSNTNFVPIGLNAHINQNGVRNDGSYYYGEFLRDQTKRDYQFPAVARRVERGKENFTQADSFSPDAVNEIRLFLEEAQARGILVVGFLPPYAPLIYQKMMGKDFHYGYIAQLQPALAPIFKNNNFILSDFSNVLPFGSSDKEFIDGFHGSEKTDLRLLLFMLEKNPALQKFADAASLQKNLEQANSDYEVFDSYHIQ